MGCSGTVIIKQPQRVAGSICNHDNSKRRGTKGKSAKWFSKKLENERQDNISSAEAYRMALHVLTFNVPKKILYCSLCEKAPLEQIIDIYTDQFSPHRNALLYYVKSNDPLEVHLFINSRWDILTAQNEQTGRYEIFMFNIHDLVNEIYFEKHYSGTENKPNFTGKKVKNIEKGRWLDIYYDKGTGRFSYLSGLGMISNEKSISMDGVKAMIRKSVDEHGIDFDIEFKRNVPEEIKNQLRNEYNTSINGYFLPALRKKAEALGMRGNRSASICYEYLKFA